MIKKLGLQALTIIVIVLLIVVVDSYLLISGGTEASISHMLISWSYDYPIFTFLVGFTMGHLFWRMRDTSKTGRLGRADEDGKS